MKNNLLVSFAILAITLSSCSSIYVDSMTPSGVRLQGYKTFAWVNPVDADGAHRYDDKVYANLILEKGTGEILKKGLTLDTVKPDVVFVFDTQIKEVREYVQDSPDVYMGVGVGSPYYYGGFYAPITTGDVREVVSNEGMLVIEMWDPVNSKLLWRGWGSQTVSMATDLDADIARAVQFIFDRLRIKP